MADSPLAASKPTEAAAPSPRRRSRFRLVVLALVVLVLAGVYYAPTLVAVTPLRQRIIPGLFPRLAARTNVGSASLGWFAPTVLYDIRIESESGEPLLEAVSVTSEHSLIALITDQKHLGRFDIDRPRAHILLRDDGSNLEDAIAPMLASEEEAAPKEFSLEIIDATLLVQETSGGGTWRLADVASTVALPLDGEKSVSVQGRIAAGQAAPEGTLSLSLKWYAPDATETKNAGAGQVDFDVQRLPLEISRGALHRFVGDVRLSGETSLHGRARWNVPAEKLDLEIAEVRGKQIEVAAPEFLAEKAVRIESFHVAGRVALDKEQLAFERVSLQSDPADVTLSGKLQLADLQQDDLWKAVFAQQVAASGKVDLAKLAAMLPETLHIRQDTRITSGQVAWDLKSQTEQQHRRLVGRIDTTGLAAESAGQLVTWDQPVQVTVALEQSDAGPVVEQLRCTSSFLQVSGSGTLREASLTAECSLDQLREELGRFVELGEFQLRGKLTSNVGWRRADDGELSATGNMQIDNLALELPGMRPWREPSLTADFRAAGRYGESGALDLSQASATVKAGDDVFDAKLLEPVADATAGKPLPVSVEFRGRLADWLARVQLFLPLEGWRLDGRADFQATGNVSPNSVALTTFAGQIDELKVQGGGLFIDEPLIKLDGKQLAAETGEGGSFSVVDATLTSSAVAVRAENVRAAAADEGASLAGKLIFRSDLGRLLNWFHDPQTPQPIHLFGEAVGEANVSLAQGVSMADLNIGVTDFTVAKPPTPENPQWQALWREPLLKVVGKAAYDGRKGAAELDNLSVQSDALQVTASGDVADLAEQVRVDLDGQLAYDLEKISPVLRPYLGDDFVLTGKKSEAFSVHGPVLAAVPAGAAAAPAVLGAPPPRQFVVSPELTADAAFGWDSARAFALDVGSGSIEAKLRDGVMQVTPIDLPVSGGRVQFAPRFLLNQQPMLMVADRGQVFEHIAITPAMCRTWLKYISPVVADATDVKGNLSTSLERAVVPLTRPLDGNVRGALTIHSAEVGPGPLGRQVLLLVRQIEYTIKRRPLEGLTVPPTVWLNMPEQTIDFQMAEGGVRHQNLHFQVGDVEVRTEGTVRFDESIDLLVMIPIRDEWTSRAWLSAMKGETLKIPVQGTLKQPKIDDSAWRSIAAKMLQGTTERLLERGLRGLFGPKE